MVQCFFLAPVCACIHLSAFAHVRLMALHVFGPWWSDATHTRSFTASLYYTHTLVALDVTNLSHFTPHPDPFSPQRHTSLCTEPRLAGEAEGRHSLHPMATVQAAQLSPSTPHSVRPRFIASPLSSLGLPTQAPVRHLGRPRDAPSGASVAPLRPSPSGPPPPSPAAS